MRVVMNPGRDAIKKFILNQNLELWVFQGGLSDFDIILKYKQNQSRLRTPKHIHWVVDILLKKQGNVELTNNLLDRLIEIWNNILPIQTRQEQIDLSPSYIELSLQYSDLNRYGFYTVEFLITLAELLMKQEKTNRRDAYMFLNVLRKSRDSDDLFSIIQASAFTGRR